MAVTSGPEASVAPRAPVADGRLSAYVARGRDLRLDFLRGVFVIGMIVDHVAGPSWLYAITGGNRFYTSAAEGFVFVSGLVAGRAYTRFIDRDGLSNGLGRLLNRAGQLYLVAVGLALVVVPVSEVFHLPWALGWNLHDALDFVVSVLTLHRTYYLVDVMSLYVLVLLASTVAFVLLVRGHTWLVLGGSWLLWLLYQLFPDQAAMPWPIVGNNLFYFSAWQVLFFTGLVIGHHWERHPTRGVLDRPVWRARVLPLSAALLAVVVAGFVLSQRLLELLVRDASDRAAVQAELLTSVFGKSDLRWGRLLVFALVFVVFFLATTAWWRGLRRWLGWLVLPLGQNALFAYSAHIFLALGAAYVLQERGGVDSTPPSESAAIQIGSLLVVWCLIQLRVLQWLFSRPPVRLAVPIALGVVALAVLPRIQLAPAAGPAVAAAPSSADAQIARAFGTAIPADTQPSIPAAALAPPVPQDPVTAATPAAPTTAATPAAATAAAPAAPAAAPATPASAAPATPAAAAPTTPAAAAPAAAPPKPTALPPTSNAAGNLKGTLYEPDFFSPALNTRERYFAYLPPDAQTRGQRLPVLYMLHGGGGRREWIDYGLISMADQAISAGKLPPMLIVLPQGDQGYWVNHIDGGPRWGDYLAQDMVQTVDATFPTLPDARHRAIGGLSMGGWGALYQAFARPNEFGIVGAHAPSLRGDDGSMPFLPRGAGFTPFDPMQLAANAPGIEGLKVWLDADDQDPWVGRDADLHTRLDQRKVANQWHVYPGRHGGTYWHDHVQDYLQFYAQALASP